MSARRGRPVPARRGGRRDRRSPARHGSRVRGDPPRARAPLARASAHEGSRARRLVTWDAERFVFAYGSLVDASSTRATLGRPLAPGDGPTPADLVGYRRAWNTASGP